MRVIDIDISGGFILNAMSSILGTHSLLERFAGHLYFTFHFVLITNILRYWPSALIEQKKNQKIFHIKFTPVNTQVTDSCIPCHFGDCDCSFKIKLIFVIDILSVFFTVYTAGVVYNVPKLDAIKLSIKLFFTLLVK